MLHKAAIAQLLNEQVQTVTITQSGQIRRDQPPEAVLLSGSFNPLHHGHQGLLAAACAKVGRAGGYELSVENADKGRLAIGEISRRAAQFTDQADLVLSRVARFAEKAHLMPHCDFVVGIDTAIRLLEPRYYGGEAGLIAALEQVRAANCRLIVGGRLLSNGHFQTLADLALPTGFASLFVGLSATEFRLDISSTALRLTKKKSV